MSAGWYVLHRYVDGTFKVVRDPFVQLFSVHAFVKKNDHLQQLPLAFVLMSRRRAVDYRGVFEALIAAMPRRPCVQAVVADFEAAVWSAVRHVLPGVTQRGCSFHFSQAIWRSVQNVGLQSAYQTDDRVNRICRLTMALPFLPATVIPSTFDSELEFSENSVRPELQAHIDYVRRNWVDSEVWPPSTWSVYLQPTRTNNNVEGWHRRLNGKAGHSKLNLYQLVQLLRTEATLADVGVKMMSEGGAARLQRKKYKRMNTYICERWGEYGAGTRSAASLLRACSHAVKHM